MIIFTLQFLLFIFTKNYLPMKQVILAIFFAIIAASAIAQKSYYTGDFRSTENPYYWKNKMPFVGYWQQDVAYDIKARLDDSLNMLDAELTLTYYNNSPDALNEVYFHLYQNAFQPGSY